MAELNPHIKWALMAVTASGSQWLPTVSGEGPRRLGYCVHCRSQCRGGTADCEIRVWTESTHPLKRA